MKVTNFFTKYLLIFIFLLSGCAVVDNIVGNSASTLERLPQSPYKQVFNYNVDDCFDKVLKFLKGWDAGARILKVNKYTYYILASISRPTLEEIESTFPANNADVIILFTPQDDKTTKIEVNSLSSLFAEYTMDKISNELNPQQKTQAQSISIQNIDTGE